MKLITHPFILVTFLDDRDAGWHSNLSKSQIVKDQEGVQEE